MRTIYCFKLNEDTGELHRIAIFNYAKRKYGNRTAFAYTVLDEGVKRRYDFREDNLDKFVNWKLYSYNSAYSSAYKIIQQTLMDKCDELECKLSKYSTALQLFLDKPRIADGGN